MFLRKNRLTKNKDFDNAFKNGFSSFDAVLGVKAVRNDLDFCRIGIMVGTKISKKAVERNKIKRRLRAAIKNFLPHIKAGYDVVVIAQPLVVEKDFIEIKKSMHKHFKRLKLI